MGENEEPDDLVGCITWLACVGVIALLVTLFTPLVDWIVN